MHRRILILFFSLTSLISLELSASGNTKIESFSKAKKHLFNEVFTTTSDRKTLYCGAVYNQKKQVTLPEGYKSEKYKKRQRKVEAEHIVPAENFGRTFEEWREGHKLCVYSKGKSFKGRNCASKVNKDYRFMRSDLYNLYPAIGANNAFRQNYNFALLPEAKSAFGSCDMRLKDRKIQPPENSRGIIARTYMYMEQTYPRYKMSKKQRKLMNEWDKQYPVTADECRRAKTIEQIQGNKNLVLRDRCK